MKIKIICAIVSLVMISTGIVYFLNPWSGPQVITPPDDKESTLMEKPAEGDPSDFTPQENLYIAAWVLKNCGGFTGKSVGTSTSMGISQDVCSERAVSGDTVFKQSTSFGLVKFGEQLYISGDNYLSRKPNKVHSVNRVDWKNEAQKYDEATWAQKIGYRCDGLTGYILNDKTILDATLEKTEDGLYTFRYVLDHTVAPYFLLFEMRNNAGASELATFTRAEIIVTMDSNWQVKTLTTDCEYNVTLNAALRNIHCVESLTETFTFVGNTVEIPEKDFFEQFFDAEIDNGGDDETTPLLVLTEMFADYLSGSKLNAQIDVSLGENELTSLLISANLDIQNLENISADVKLGNDLYLSYLGGKVYAAFKDFKASTTVDGIMSFVNTLLPQASAGLDSVDLDSLLDGLTYTVDGNKCMVNLPLSLGNVDVNVNFYADVNGKKYNFTGADATIGDVCLDIKPVGAWEMPARGSDSEYPEILGLTDLISDGAITLNAELFGINADVMLNIPTKQLYVKGDGIFATLSDNKLFAALGGAKVKLDLSTSDELAQLFAPLFNGNIATPEINLDDILTAVSNISTQTTDSGVILTFGLQSLGLQANVTLNSSNDRWQLAEVKISMDSFEATLTPAEKFDVPAVNENEYADITEIARQFAPKILALVNADAYAMDIDLSVTVNGKTYRISGALTLDASKNVQVDAAVYENGISIAEANVIFGAQDKIVFLTVNGIKAAFAADGGEIDFSEIASKINLENSTVTAIAEKITNVINSLQNVSLENLDLSSLGLATLVDSLNYQNGKLSLVANGSILGLGTINLDVETLENGLQAELKNFALDNVTLNAKLGVSATDRTVAIPAAKDYRINLSTEIAGIGVKLTADLVDMDIYAQIELPNDVLNVRFKDNTVYAKLGNNKIRLTLQEALAFVNNLGILGNADATSLDINALLNNLQINLATDRPNVKFVTEGFEAGIYFTRNENIVFEKIAVKVNENEYTATPSASEAPKLAVTNDFISVAPLLNKVAELVKTYKNLEQGISVNADADIVVNNAKYNLHLELQYNNGIHAKAVLTTPATDTAASVKLLAADLYYLKDNAGDRIYLDVNGLRVAVDTNKIQSLLQAIVGNTLTADGNGTDVLSQLANSKLLGGIFDAIDTIKNGLDTLSISTLLESLTYDAETDVWSIAINGTTLGLGNATLQLDDGLTISNLQFAGIEVTRLTAGLGTCQTVTAPQEEYTTELQVAFDGISATLKLDLLNLTIDGYVEAFNNRIDVYLENGVLYLVCGNARMCLGIDRINDLLSEIGRLTGNDLGNVSDSASLDIAAIIDSITISTENGLALSVTIGGTEVSAQFDADAQLQNITAELGNGKTLTANVPAQTQYNTFDPTANYVDALSVIETYGQSIKDVLNADGYNVSANGTLRAGDNSFDISATVKFNKKLVDNGEVVRPMELYAQITLAYNKHSFESAVKILDAALWLKNNTIYVTADELNFAIKLKTEKDTNTDDNGDVTEPAKPITRTFAQTLAPYYGYNAYVDKLLALVENIAQTNLQNMPDFAAILNAFTFDEQNGALNLTVDGSQFGIPENEQYRPLSAFEVALGKTEKGLSLGICDLAISDIALNLNAEIEVNTAPVIVPSNVDWTTKVKVSLDSDNENVLYGKLNFLTNEFDFVLVNNTPAENGETKEPMYIKYSDGVIKIKKGTDIRVSGDLNKIVGIVKRIDEIVNSFAGKATETSDGNDSEQNNDSALKEIVSSLRITQNDDGTAVAYLTALGMPVALTFTEYDNEPTFSIGVDVSLMNRYIVATVNKEVISFEQFEDTSDFHAIDEILEDYMTPINELILTNSWRFDFDGDLQIDIVDNQNKATGYIIAAGSYLEFFYNKNHPADTTICASLSIKQHNGGNSVIDLANVEILYYGGRIYITYNQSLKLTVDLQSIKDTKDAFEDLKKAIPQLSVLLDKISDTMSSAKDNLDDIDFTTIIRKFDYDKTTSEFSLTLNAGVLISGLGDISISAVAGEDTMTLTHMMLTYDNVSVTVNNLRVSAVEAYPVETPDEGSEGEDTNKAKTPHDYAIIELVNNYFAKNGTAVDHMNFDSITELVQAVADTANKTTFVIDGLITAKLNLGSFKFLASATIPLQVNVRVDIVHQNADDDDPSNDYDDVYIAAMITRFNTKAKVLTTETSIYNGDNGGQSYLYFDSTVKYAVTETTSDDGTTKLQTILDDNGNPYIPEGTDEKNIKNGWITVSRYPYSYQKATEEWTEIEVYDHCVTENKDATDDCYPTCQTCGGKQASTNCYTTGYCAYCQAMATDSCGSKTVEYCVDCGKKAPTGLSALGCIGHKKIKAAHSSFVHNADSVVAPCVIETRTRTKVNGVGTDRPYIEENAQPAHFYTASATDFTTKTTLRNGTEISMIENELYEMLNLGKISFLDLENLIIENVHPKDGSSSTDTSTENLISNLQNIFKAYKYTVPEQLPDGTQPEPYFYLKLDLSPIDKNFGILDLNIGHTIEYKEREIKDEFDNVIGTETVIDKLNLTYLRGSFSLASVLDLDIQLTLEQDTAAYEKDAMGFVQNQTVWNAGDHAAK